jgi:hypothetical protein
MNIIDAKTVKGLGFYLNSKLIRLLATGSSMLIAPGSKSRVVYCPQY